VLKRASSSKHAWAPNVDDRVCSDHFVDGEPTPNNPIPTLKLGYVVKTNKVRRKLVRQDDLPVHVIDDNGDGDGDGDGAALGGAMAGLAVLDGNVEDVETDACNDTDQQVTLAEEITDEHVANRSDLQGTTVCDHTYSASVDCEDCASKQSHIILLTKQVNTLKRLRKKTRTSQLNAKKYLESDAKVRFYTGLPDKTTFKVLLEYVSSDAQEMTYWKGKRFHSKVTSSKVQKEFRKKRLRSRTLSVHDELLLVLMRLKLGSLNGDLADRFEISAGLASRIINTWLKFLAMKLKGLLTFPPREFVQANMPSSFRQHYSNCRCIIDCTEVHIERPRDLYTQAATWSDYKKHNTAKFLVAITPMGMICFVSDGWGGRTSDKHITLNSGFLDNLDPHDMVMADRGFSCLKTDFLLRHATMEAPPGARGREQMIRSDVEKTKRIANLRIHVERAINRIKYFRILRYTLPISLLPLVDEIFTTCAALSNLSGPLVR
jgi:hypothetical protein